MTELEDEDQLVMDRLLVTGSLRTANRVYLQDEELSGSGKCVEPCGWLAPEVNG